MFGKKNKELDFEFSDSMEGVDEEKDGDFHTPLDMPEGKPKKSSSTRLLLLVLLLVVAAAGAWFYLGGMPPSQQASAPPPAGTPVKQPISMPAPPPVAKAPAAPVQQEDAAAPMTANAPAPSPAAAAPSAAGPAPQVVSPPAGQASPDVAAPSPAAAPVPPQAASQPAAVDPKPVAASAAVPTRPAEPSAAAEPKAVAPVAAAETQAVEPSAAVEPQAAVPPTPASGKYMVDAGAFLLEGNRKKAERIISKLGYKPRVSTVKRPMEMVRLRHGIFPAEVGEYRLRELQEFAPDAFSLRQGDRVALYAGSFSDLDRARSYADQLYLRGIEIVEEKVTVPMTMHRITFGPFTTQAAAKEAAKRVRAAGLEAKVSGR